MVHMVMYFQNKLYYLKKHIILNYVQKKCNIFMKIIKRVILKNKMFFKQKKNHNIKKEFIRYIICYKLFSSTLYLNNYK